MKKTGMFLYFVFLLCPWSLAQGQYEQAEQTPNTESIFERETLTDGFFGLSDSLEDEGIEVGLGITNIYQKNTHGGTTTSHWAGRITGSYDLEISADLEKLFGANGNIYIHLEGGWPDTEGIDGSSIGSVFGVNADAIGDRAVDVVELWFEQSFIDDNLTIRIGKMDLTGGFEHHGCPVSFDCSNFANDEATQFLNGALVNNPTIPFPDYGLGIAFHYSPDAPWYVSGAVADAEADGRETGLRTTFYGEDYFLYIFEAGITPELSSGDGPLQGAYRVGLWYDPQPKANTDLDEAGESYRDDIGVYFSCNQTILKENSKPEDTQGLGAFFRYGYADDKRNDITDFWSFGFQYQGLIDGRDEDILAVGFAQGFFSDKASDTYTDDYESVFEVYYNTLVAGWLNISPSIQYITNPGGEGTGSDALVAAVRAQVNL